MNRFPANLESALRGRSVFLTGHTGFTGSWMSLCLRQFDCVVHGYSLRPSTKPNLFDDLGGPRAVASSHIGNINDFAELAGSMEYAQPELVLHLAAQPLVRASYAEPVETLMTNVIGTAHVLEAARNIPSVKAVLCVTTDKVYRNDERNAPYSEEDRLGGKDPYSASKAAAELVASCYRETMTTCTSMRIATTRGGNIIGGGDWSTDRIVPDFYRAASRGEVLKIRNPESVRPWQHVLDACAGYLAVSAALLDGHAGAASAWNIGPADDASVTVRELTGLLASMSSRAPDIEYEKANLHEAGILRLDASKARNDLGVRSPWSIRDTIAATAHWYESYLADPRQAGALCQTQVLDYFAAMGLN